ncbi:FAD/FMN-containing dehydrogenase [Paenibacillus sp. P32E]|uniref:FAD/FMN-containing dehydrogenase n=1 Tax=Paenibacillus sp. P32E TaxID=1349434 RepID=UPI00093F3061|nr:FAD/FMN-containing dehydrogenase [Paenibacillus sp. P32E]OKP92988.1 FAD/FMN-containing dehydrogenase [Paenibacillus sp. P32E]
MKKIWLGIIALVLVMGIGTSVYAASNDDGQSWFENMLPFAKQMHPDLTDSQVKDMVNHCRSGQGTNTSGMMDRTSGRGGMMNF